MKNLRTKLFIAIVALVCVSIILNVTLYCSFHVFPDQLKVNTVELKSKKIPKEMDGVSILYFTDVQFGEFQTNERTKRLFKKIKNLHPDVLIYGGDLYDTDHTISGEEGAEMVKYFSDINAPLGKYAVLGEKDSTKDKKETILSIYSQAQCEVLSNTPIKITNSSKDGIELVGLDVKPNYDITSNLNKSEYTLLVTHQPDALLDPVLQAAPIDLALAGHSHGTQITIPLYGGYQTIKGAKNLNRTEEAKELPFEYIISTGVGCTNINARLNAQPEIYYFILKSSK